MDRSFKEILVQLLQKNNITAYKLSKDLGISETLISQWKNGRQVPKYDSIKILCQYFDVSSDYILGMTDNPNTRSITNNVSGIMSGNNVVGSNGGSFTMKNPQVNQEYQISDEAKEILRIYESLDVRKRMKLLNTAFSLEEEK